MADKEKKQPQDPKNLAKKDPKETSKIEAMAAESAKPQDTIKISKTKIMIAIVSIIIIIAVIAAVYLVLAGSNSVPTGTTARYGDTVSVLYAGKFENGTVFDTNREDVAQAAGLQRTTFDLLEFTIGQQQLIPGFEAAMLGMRIGEKKTVTLEPSQAYGEYDSTMVFNVPRVQQLNKTVTINKTFTLSNSTFSLVFNKAPVLNDIVTEQQEKINYKVTSIKNGTITIESVVKVGDNIVLYGTYWNSTVISVGTKNVTLRQNPVDGQTFPTTIGEAVVTVTGEKILITQNTEVGKVIRTTTRDYIVKGINNENITLDGNHALAGKRLIFDIELVNITIGNTTAA